MSEVASQPCTACGNPVSNDEQKCPACGFANPYAYAHLGDTSHLHPKADPVEPTKPVESGGGATP